MSNPGAVRSMLSSAPHRGWSHEVRSLGRCSFGVTNDPDHSEASLASGSGLLVAFSGVLDEPGELERMLPHPNGDHRDRNPAALVLAGFVAVGEKLLPFLRGNFSCLITDGARLWAFRDQIGFESLFHREDSEGVYVATEAKQVLAGAGISPEPDLEVVEALFYGDQEDATACALRGVRRLLAGTLLEATGERVSTRRYWDPTPLLETARLGWDDVVERFHELFTQAVRRTLTGRDVVALSGGIDSPPITAYGNEEHMRLFGRPLPALSEVYPFHASSDETRYVELVANHHGIPLHAYEPGRQRLDRLQEWVKLFDGPWSTVAPEGTSQRCLQVRELGCRTLLTGHFAEHSSAAGHWYLTSHLLWRGRFRAAWGHVDGQLRAGVGRRRIALQILEALTPRVWERRRLRRTPRVPMPAWIDRRRIANRDQKSVRPARKRWTAFQLPFFGGGTNGEVDIYSHAVHGVRPRRPWADLDLWEFFVSLPAEVKLPDHRVKGFARTVLRGRVPDDILDRRDKTATTEYFADMCLDYDALKHWLLAPEYRVAGVDYELLATDLENQDMSLAHYLWARDLAAVHAFLELWSGSGRSQETRLGAGLELRT